MLHYLQKEELSIDRLSFTECAGKLYAPFWKDTRSMNFEEAFLLTLALVPHLEPCVLDLFYVQNPVLRRPYTEFGGILSKSNSSFLPTAQTAVFLLTLLTGVTRKDLFSLLGKEHRFYKERLLWVEESLEAEPWINGLLRVSEALPMQLSGVCYQPEYSVRFPATWITTSLEWEDLVPPPQLAEEVDEINYWIGRGEAILAKWQLGRLLKPGYRLLFYGPPGTGKTLTTLLLGKTGGMDVYRVDLSSLVSKYIGETEKNLANLFDTTAHRNWILFFDEADALFSERTASDSSNDWYANQEVAYLLQRIEDFPGILVLATNLRGNIDNAFFRRFQSVLYFPMPDEELRFRLWKKMIPCSWVEDEQLLWEAATHKLAGGHILNVIRSCAVKLHRNGLALLTREILLEAIAREESKEGKLITSF
ncbi:MAG: ATP-binding protein [Bacteroides sp.]|nr:ATP-binding protein [Bacteroides sp.]